MIERRSVFNLCRVFSAQCCVAERLTIMECEAAPLLWSHLGAQQSSQPRQKSSKTAMSSTGEAVPVSKLEQHSKLQQMFGPRVEVEYTPTNTEIITTAVLCSGVTKNVKYTSFHDQKCAIILT